MIDDGGGDHGSRSLNNVEVVVAGGKVNFCESGEGGEGCGDRG